MTNVARASSCIVVGAGISGLVAARSLSDAGWRVVVLEETRNVGGRMATRLMGKGTFDSGAQFFTVRSESFGRLVTGWIEAGVVKEWTRGFANAKGKQNYDGHPRYRGSEGMGSVPRHLARTLDVRTGERVLEVNVRDGAWEARTESGSRETGAALVLTAPVPRSLELIGSRGFELPDGARRDLANISYAPCLALMALLDGSAGVPEPGGVQIKGEPLDWIGDNQRKGISQVPGITIHAGPKWSREHFEAEEQEITASLLSIAGAQLDTDLASHAAKTSLIRWRHSWVMQPHPELCLVASEDPALLFAGDAFGAAKVEGATLSGLAAADHLLGRTKI
jgi:predicted NAD/FAD-dependent oxidoreductase